MLFTAALPGFILGFFTLHDRAANSVAGKYALLVLFVLVSAGLFYAIQAMSPLSPAMLTVGFAAVAINLYYWFSGPIIIDSLAQVTGVRAGWLRWPITVAIAALTLLWIARTRVSELQFAWTTGGRKEPVLLSHDMHIQKLLEYYMGKNTPERQRHIIDNLRVEKDVVEELLN